MRARPVRATPGRRAVLLGAVGAVLAGCGSERRTPPAAPSGAERLRYGEHPDQVLDLRRPAGGRVLGTVALLHGGYWLPQYALDQLDGMAELLTSQGWVTANLEYRATGDGGGVPRTLEDVAAALDLLAERDVPDTVVALGHSAGGQLAAWAAARRADLPGGAPRVPLTAAVSLSGVLDLTTAATGPGSSDPVQGFVGGTPDAVPDAYAAADPTLLTPTCPVAAVHATDDQVVPLSQSESYVAAHPDRARLVEVPGDHLSIIDTAADSWTTIDGLLREAASSGGSG